jgi:hypothetical protein
MNQENSVTADQVALLAMERRSQSSFPRYEPLPGAGQLCEFPVTERDALVSRYFEFGRISIISGSAALPDFLGHILCLENLSDTCGKLGKREPMSQRYLGPLEACLARINGRWVDLGSEKFGRRLVAALDEQRARIFAVRVRDDGSRPELDYAELSADGALEWHLLCRVPTGCLEFVDFSLLVPVNRGLAGIARLLTSTGRIEHRLLTIQEHADETGSHPEALWSEPMGEEMSVLRPDYRSGPFDIHVPAKPTGLLFERRIPGGYRIESPPKSMYPLSLYAYFQHAVNAPRRMNGLSYLPPVLTT